MISKRLKAIGDVIPNDSYVIDVGCDHALLDIYIVKNKNCRAIASDIKEGPLLKAEENIKNNNLTDKIKTSLSDGINAMPDDIDVIVLSGMGTNTILKILSSGKDKLDNIKHIIVSTQSDYYLLRKGMLDFGFIINNENFIYDKKYYLIIDFVKGNRKYTERELTYGPILIKSKNADYKKYLEREIYKLKLINKKLSFTNFGLKLKNYKKIKEMKKIL